MEHRQYPLGIAWTVLILAWCTLLQEPVPAPAAVFDYAETILAETESNNTPQQAQDLVPSFAAGFHSLGLAAAVNTPADVDYYAFSAGQNARLDLKMELPEPLDQSLTALGVAPAGRDGRLYFLAGNSVWQAPAVAGGQPTLLAGADQIAATLHLADPAALRIIGLASLPDPNWPVAVSLAGPVDAGGGNVLLIAADGAVSLAAAADTLAALTGRDPNLGPLAADPDGRLYIIEQATAGVLLLTPQPGQDPPYDAAWHTPAQVLAEAVQRDVLAEINQDRLQMPRTVIAQTTGPFQVNSLVAGAGLFATSDQNSYYLSQLGPDFGGDGGITRVRISRADPNLVVFDSFFTPDAAQTNLNPSALALDTSASGTFGNFLYLGTFGPSLGDDFDGSVFRVDDGGALHPFITAYLDRDGNPATRDGQVVTGLFDVTDLAFPPTLEGPFGPRLYALSENADNNGDAPGGFRSDLWRISPDGTAQLFVENFTDGAIALAFSGWAYGNDLFVATYQDAKVLRIDPAGNVSTFFDFTIFGPDLMVCDLVFGPEGLAFRPLAGKLLLTLRSGSTAYLIALEPDGVHYQTWAANLNVGDVSSGDLVFDPQGNLVVAQQAAKNLLRFDYEHLLSIRLEGLALRPELVNPGQPSQASIYVPYLLASVGDLPRLLRLADTGQAADVATEASPSVLDLGAPPADGSPPVAFTFDQAGNLYVYSQNTADLRRAPRAADGQFRNFSPLVSGRVLAGRTGLTDPRLVALAADPAGPVYALAHNATPALPAGRPPFQQLDDQLVRLGAAADAAFNQPTTLLTVPALTRLTLTLAGPRDPNTFEIAASQTLDERLDNLPGGDYLLAVRSPSRTPVPYNLVVALNADFDAVITATEAASPRTLTTLAGQRLRLSCTGPGQAALAVEQRPDGTIIATRSLTLAGTSSRTAVALQNLDDPAAGALDEVVLNGPLGALAVTGAVQTLRAPAQRAGTLGRADFYILRQVDVPRFLLDDFHAISLGDPNTTGLKFLARTLHSLRVDGDLANLQILPSASRNSFRLIDVGGTASGCTVSGRALDRLVVRNVAAQPDALADCNFNFVALGGAIGEVLVERGNVARSTFRADRRLERVELVAGNLTACTLAALHKNGRLGAVYVGAGSPPDPDAGRISASSLSAAQRIDRVHADGDVAQDVFISVGSALASRLKLFTTAGNCAARLSGARVDQVLVGFDRLGQRRPEDLSYAGSDFTGSISALLALGELNATGKILNASISAAAGGHLGRIINLFVEDGIENTAIRAGASVTRIMVGYENGRRDRLVNDHADVSGAITASNLGRLYYTGKNTMDLSGVRRLGPVIDDNPNP